MAMLLARWAGLDVPTIVVDRPGWLSVKRRTNSILLMPASLRRPAMPEVSQFRWPTPGSWLSGPARQFLSSDAAPRAAPDDRARAGIGGLGDEFLVIALDRRVRDLEDVEDAHGEMIGQIRQDARHADEADPSFGLEVPERLNGVIHLERRLTR